MNLVLNAAEAIGSGRGVIALSTARLHADEEMLDRMMLSRNSSAGAGPCMLDS